MGAYVLEPIISFIYNNFVLQGKIHIHKKRVYGFHLDFYQHVNNARYLEFFEEARWEYLLPLKKSKVLEKRNWITIVVRAEVSYKKPLELFDDIEIHTSIDEIGRKSMTFHQKIYKNGEKTISAKADIKFVVYDTVQKKSLTINDEIKTIFEVL